MLSSPKKLSQPYLIIVKNLSASPAFNVDIGESYIARTLPPPPYQNTDPLLGQVGINITFGVPTVNYIDWLAQTEEKPFRAGRTILICEGATGELCPAPQGSDPSTQLQFAVKFTHLDATGKLADKNYMPTFSPYQGQQDRLCIDYEYQFDGYTRIRFSKILGCTKLSVLIYPLAKFDASNIFQPATKEYEQELKNHIRNYRAPNALMDRINRKYEG